LAKIIPALPFTNKVGPTIYWPYYSTLAMATQYTSLTKYNQAFTLILVDNDRLVCKPQCNWPHARSTPTVTFQSQRRSCLSFTTVHKLL